jgi:hypothetical protein
MQNILPEEIAAAIKPRGLVDDAVPRKYTLSQGIGQCTSASRCTI